LENNRDEILNLPHDDMLILFGALMQEIRYLELNLDNELRDDVLNYLRNEFEKSQLKKESKSKLLQQIKQQGSTTKKVEKEETSSILESQINRKKNSIELSDQIIEDLVEYFGHDVDKKLERSLRNCG
jgi:hypothetical protein